MKAAELEQLALDLFGAYGEGEMDRMRSLMAEDMVGWVTNSEGRVDRTDGRDAYMERLPNSRAASSRPGSPRCSASTTSG